MDRCVRIAAAALMPKGVAMLGSVLVQLRPEAINLAKLRGWAAREDMLKLRKGGA